jgi:hypothetical protein
MKERTMSKIEELKGWFNEISRYCGVDEFLDIVEDEGEGDGKSYEHRLRVKLYTNDHVYTIVAHERDKDEGYLGCVSSTRKPRAGEDWTRGNDLADGHLNKETWDKIKNDIIAYELVPIAPKVEQVDIPVVGPSIEPEDGVQDVGC